MQFENRVAFITGGSSGIGLAMARLLSQQGAHVWLAARRQSQLETALEEIRGEKRNAQQSFGIVCVDITQPHAAEQAVEEVIREVGTPDYLFNSAGAAHPGIFQDTELDIFEWMMAVNYFGTVHMTRAVLPRMISRGTGHIINFSSLTGIISIFGYSAYAGSKFAVRGFSDALRSEMKPLGIDISIVFPADTDTPQLAYENQFKPPETKEIAGLAASMTAGEVAKLVLKDVARKRYLILPGREAKFWYWAANLAGPLQYPIIDFLVARAQKKLGHPG